MNLVLNQNEIYLLILASFILILLVWNFVLHFRFKRLVRGSKKKTIEDSLNNIYKYIENANAESKRVNASINTLQNKLKKSPRGFGMLNFKAFDGVKSGGVNSFAIAFVNDEGNGLILSTFHARDRVNVFSKEIKAFKSEVMLTEEETAALEKARQSLN
jgi:hypothetical protein